MFQVNVIIASSLKIEETNQMLLDIITTRIMPGQKKNLATPLGDVK